MNAEFLAIALVAFVAGFGAGLTLPRVQPIAVARHWKLVNDLNAYLRDPANYTDQSPGGLRGATVPYDIEPCLTFLVGAGELEHVDIVFPRVRNNAGVNRRWMRIVDQHQDTIVRATGNLDYGNNKPPGDPPLHLNLWFKESGREDVQRLIKELEDLATEEH